MEILSIIVESVPECAFRYRTIIMLKENTEIKALETTFLVGKIYVFREKWVTKGSEVERITLVSVLTLTALKLCINMAQYQKPGAHHIFQPQKKKWECPKF